MLSSLQQFVPSEICLKCQGCCRFKSMDSPWRPKVGEAEKNVLALRITGNFTDDQNYIQAIEDCGNHFCRFFNQSDSTCQVYTQRPFECALYPFILSKSIQGIAVYVHLACPFVQDHQSDELTRRYINYLQEFFHLPQTKDFLKRNQRLLHDYFPFEAELQFLFTIKDLIL